MKVRYGFSLDPNINKGMGDLCPPDDASCQMTGPYVNPIDPRLQPSSGSGIPTWAYALGAVAFVAIFMLPPSYRR